MNDRQKILIVDDKEKNLYALEKVLEKVDTDIVGANCGNDALIATLNHEFALAILDIQMPGMSGYELAEHLRNDERTRNLPIIFLTAVYSDEYHVFKGYEAGAVDFLTKPYREEILLAKVRIFLQLDHQRRELEKILELEKAKNHLENILLSMTDAVMVVSKEGFIQTANEAALSLLDYASSEIIGKPFANLLEEPCAISEEKPLSSKDMRDPAYHNKEATVLTKHREAIPVLISRSAFHDRDNLLLGTVIVAKDIRDRKLAEKALRDSEIKHKTLVNNIPGMIYRAYPDWSAEVISGSEAICGYSKKELMSKEGNWQSIIHPDDKEKVVKDGSELTHVQKDIVQTYRIKTKGGHIQWVEDRKTSIFSEKGEFFGIDGVVFNITDRKSAEEDRLAHERLQGVIETAGAVCHELNQPLQAISGFSELILIKFDGDNPLSQRINKIKEQVDRIAVLTRKFTEIVRYTSKPYDRNTKILDINETQDRRRYVRHIPKSGAVVSIEPDPLKQVPIIDISQGGLAFYYNDRENQLDKSGVLTLLIPDENLALEEIPYNIVASYSKPGPFSSNHYHKTRFGLQFENLKTQQLMQLKGVRNVN